jgi:hypothetical protein
VRITAKSTIQKVIEAVAIALDRAGIKAVFVGGACATIYTGGAYESDDLDLIIQSAPTQKTLDGAMATIGYTRQAAQYFHARSDFFVEFPRGPLSIGQDVRISPVRLKVGRSKISALSATDSCRDRLAAFYHWDDRQSLEVAVAIALNNRVSFAIIRRWSAGEMALPRFEEFRKALHRARRTMKARARKRLLSTPRPRRAIRQVRAERLANEAKHRSRKRKR